MNPVPIHPAPSAKPAPVPVRLATIGFTAPLAPGADNVKLTQNAADVAGCKAVGNVSTEYDLWHPQWVEASLRNKTVGLDGNALFLTLGTAERKEGVAYRCP